MEKAINHYQQKQLVNIFKQGEPFHIRNVLIDYPEIYLLQLVI